MDLQMLNNISELLLTIQEAVDYLCEKQDKQMEEEICYSREYITSCLENNFKRPIRQWIEADAMSHKDWLTEVGCVLDDLKNPFHTQNKYDKEFLNLMEYIWKTTADGIAGYLKQRLKAIKIESPEIYYAVPEYFSTYDFWGTLNPEKEDYTSFERRAHVLKQRSFEFLWLYKRLTDYTSKQTLYAILLNWALLDMKKIQDVTSIFTDYYEPDIFPTNQGDVFIDVGAFVGDSIYNYVQSYGNGYKRIYAYEISEESCKQLKENTIEFHDIVIRQVGAGSKYGHMALENNQQSSANKLTVCGMTENEKLIEIVALDDDIQEKVTFIKMDIEGAEGDALLGCRKIIQEQQPKLAVCVYHGYDDLWRLPRLIDSMNPEYKFYLRHYGGNVMPTEFVLLCK